MAIPGTNPAELGIGLAVLLFCLDLSGEDNLCTTSGSLTYLLKNKFFLTIGLTYLGQRQRP